MGGVTGWKITKRKHQRSGILNGRSRILAEGGVGVIRCQLEVGGWVVDEEPHQIGRLIRYGE